MADEFREHATPPFCIIIPARFASTRFPGKPLCRLRGRSGVERPLIEWSWRAAQAVRGVEKVVVATDDRRIADEVERFGGKTVMTPPECANGTERCAAAVAAMTDAPELIVNLQGDAPLTPAPFVETLVSALREDAELQVSTAAIPCTPETYAHLAEDRANGRVGGTTVVLDRSGNALYFSKNIIPYVPEAMMGQVPVHLHLGVYAYRRSALYHYAASAPSILELSEGLEQLRFLDQGIAVRTIVCDAPDGLLIELNNPNDVKPMEAELSRRGLD